jgi:hypothetical protein
VNRPILAALCALALASPSAAEPPRVEQVDKGSFVVYSRGRVVGAESFSIEASGDSLNVFSQAHQTFRTESGEETVDKQMILVANRADFGLKMYQSNQKFRGREVVRGIVIGDTAFTLYREADGGGEGDRRVLPPGRLFVLDSQLFSLFDLICLSLKSRTFETWPISLVTLGERDSVLEATVTHLGSETVRWAAKPVKARKLRFSDGETTFLLWADPAGRMLRLVHEPTELRVERDAPPVKKRPASQPRSETTPSG